MSTAVTPANHSLFELEQDMLAWADTEEMVSPEQRAEYEKGLAEALKKTVAKRDRCGEFLSFCEAQIDAADKEIKRLQARKATYKGYIDRMRDYVKYVIESLGFDEKGKMRKLEGERYTFSLRNNPGTVDVADANKIPESLKSVSITLTVEEWNGLVLDLEGVGAGFSVQVLKKELRDAEAVPDRKLILQRLKEGREVAGADLKLSTSLVVK